MSLPPLPKPREEIAVRASQIIGSSIVTIVDKARGWPSRVLVKTSSGTQRIAFHIGPIGTHSRASYERRFQNLPDKSLPVAAPGGAFPILVGITIDPVPVLVAVDGRSRLGKTERFSLLFHERVLREAATLGWSEYVSATGERFIGMNPQLFPVAVELLMSGVTPSIVGLVSAATASGLLTSPTPEAAERARKAASVLVRDAKFSQDVRNAYGAKCAMCGLGIELVEGAHILPVSAPGSTDDVWNGIALCRNHHRAFDTHRLHIDAATYRVRKHPSILAAAAGDAAVRRFIDQTLPILTLPPSAALRPRPAMLQARGHFFKQEYGWL